MIEIIKNSQNTRILKMCASCASCYIPVESTWDDEFRKCLARKDEEGNPIRVRPKDGCENLYHLSSFMDGIKTDCKGQVKRKEYLDFVLWARTNPEVPKEIKSMDNECLRAQWESQNHKSIYYRM